MLDTISACYYFVSGYDSEVGFLYQGEKDSPLPGQKAPRTGRREVREEKIIGHGLTQIKELVIVFKTLRS